MRHNATLAKNAELGKLPPKMPPQVQVFKPDDEFAEASTDNAARAAIEAAPAPRVSEADLKQHPEYIEAMARVAQGLDGRNARERQLMSGNTDVLRPSRAEADHVGVGGPDPRLLKAPKPSDPDYGTRTPIVATVTTRVPLGRRVVGV